MEWKGETTVVGESLSGFERGRDGASEVECLFGRKRGGATTSANLENNYPNDNEEQDVEFDLAERDF